MCTDFSSGYSAFIQKVGFNKIIQKANTTKNERNVCDSEASLTEGVQIFECANPSHASGLHWLPHARMRFTDVQIKRTDMLEQHCIFRKNGKYASTLKKYSAFMIMQ